uniref:Tetraspanin-33 n=1 Tax=Otus sunia TaxID=257818 RepID=A0A8C8BHK1_9STRI
MARPQGDEFSFVSPAVKYVLFFFNALFWMISMATVAAGVYARLLKHAEAAVDLAVLFMAVGVLIFLITFCGCVGSLRENICLLQAFSVCLTIVFLLQLAASVLGFVFSDKARGKVSDIINAAIVHYRDDLDLQNLIDFGQKEFSCCGGVSYKDWSQNMYFNCTPANPSQERCSVPFSCCLRDTHQVRTVSSGLGGTPRGLVGILLAQILIHQIKDQIKLQLYNHQHRADPWY